MKRLPYLQIEQGDNLIVALRTIEAGSVVTIDNRTITIRQEIPAKQKFALNDLGVGDETVMYGVIVGQATQQIQAGELISTTNLKHATTAYSEEHQSFQWQPPALYEGMDSEFMGFRRENGKAGTANYWIFVPLVFCSNQELNLLKEVLPRALGYTARSRYEQLADGLADRIKSGGSLSEPVIKMEMFDQPSLPLFPNVDGVRFLTHSLGCGSTPDDVEDLCVLLANYITHPNVAGATVISLGCQIAEISVLKEKIREKDPQGFKKVFFYDRQTWNHTADMHEAIIRQTFAALKQADNVIREPIPLSELVVGVECGGSDGFSGISANPVIGRMIDHIVGAGGSAILSEFPELCGVENELVARCKDRQTAERFMDLLSRYRKKAQAAGFDFDFNPSPGNIRDGLITDAMKSAGAAKKGGTAAVVGVLDYTESIAASGLNLLCTPGNDVESTTALVGSGANLIVFSTGLGTPTGNPIVPVIKVATNSDLARRLEQMIDFDAGQVISGENTIDGLAEKLERLCLETASGHYKTKSFRLGQEDFIPWKRGVSL